MEALDAAMVAHWESKTGQKLADYGTIASGRNRFLNLVDWVKAHFTSEHITRKVEIDGEEFRVYVAPIGYVRNEAIYPRNKLDEIITRLVELYGKRDTTC